MTKRTSSKIANLSWICSIFVVIIHAATYAANLPGAALQTVYGLNFATFFQLFFTEGICRVAVPLFFVISGYLFYRNYQSGMKWHFDKICKRLRTNGIPYLIWGCIVIAVFWIAQMIPATAQYFASADRDITQFTAVRFLEVIFLEPINSPLWFLRDLLILAIVSPLLTFLCKKLSWIWIGFLVLVWTRLIPIPIYIIRIESILFFSIGAVLSLHHIDWIECKRNFPRVWAYVAITGWMIFLFIKTYYLCSLDSKILINGDYNATHFIFDKVNCVVSIPVLWIMYDIVFSNSEKKWKVGQYGFLMFVMHHPLIGVVKKLLLKAMGINYTSVTISFVFAIILTTSGVILFGFIMKKIMPKIYDWITGGR